MKKLVSLVCFSVALILFGLSVVRAESVSARLTALKLPTPTFAEVHRAFVRISANESGFFSIADQDGILQSMLNGGGGGRVWSRRHRGTGHGLDYARLMRRMARHSTRTFPPWSKFLSVTVSMRVLANRQTRLNRWTSTMELDCREPPGWPKTSLSGEPMLPWDKKIRDRCERLVETTHGLLVGRIQSYCNGQPLTWGNESDITRPGGALDKGWTQIHCDRPPGDLASCAQMTRSEIWSSSTGCARNTFWTWLITDREATDGKRKRANGAGS